MIFRFVRKLLAAHAHASSVLLALFWVAAAIFCERCVFAQQPPAVPCSVSAEAQQFIDRQQWEQAAQALRLLVAGNPSCPDSRYLLGYTLLRANEAIASLQAYSEAASLRPPTSNDFTAIASDYILLKAYSDAQRWLLRAVQITPVSPQAWYLLGRTQYNLDRNAAAVESFKRSLTINPQDPRSEYNLGLAYERLQQPDLARAAYETAIQWVEAKHLPDAQPYLDLGILTRSQGHPAEALLLLQKAAALSPGNPVIFQELGRTFSDLHRLDQAIDAFKKATTLAPSAEPPHFFLGRAYRAAGRASEADEQFAIVQKMLANKSSSATPNTDYPH